MNTSLLGNAALDPAFSLRSLRKRHRQSILLSGFAAILLGTIVGAQTVAAAIASFSFPDFSNAGALRTFKNAYVADGILTLTPQVAGLNGTATYGERLWLSEGFDTTFTFRVSNPSGVGDANGAPGGDGLALVIQGIGAAYTGPTVGYIPYSIPNAIAVEFDTWNNGNLQDPDGNHVSIQDVGPSPNGHDEFSHSRTRGFGTPAVNVSDGRIHTAHVRYRPGLIEVFLDNSPTPIASAALDLTNLGGRSALMPDGGGWLALVAGTGGAYERHEVLSWTFERYGTAPPNRPPVLRGTVPNQTAIPGTAFNYTLPADLFEDPDFGQTLTYSVAGQPPGIGFIPASRTFQGFTTAWGEFPVVITAMDDGNPAQQAQTTFTMNVLPPRYGVTAYGYRTFANLPGWNCVPEGGYCWAESDAGSQVSLEAFPSPGGVILGWFDNNGVLHRGSIYSFVLERTVVLQPLERRPYGGYAWTATEPIQAEDFDDGFNDYSDTTPANLGLAYRGTGVDLYEPAPADGRHWVGGTAAGEWMRYTIHVPSNGYYRVDTRVANGQSAVTPALRFEFDDGVSTANLAVPDTGGGESWQTFPSTSVWLRQGIQVVRLFIVQGGMNLDYFKLVPIVEHPPQVTLALAGPDATAVAGVDALLEATATDAEGWIASIQFLLSGTPTGPLQPGSPATLAWRADAPGTYTFRAVATDNAGLNATSAPVSVTLDSIKTIRLGGLKAEYFLGLTGRLLADLTNSAKFINNQPDLVEVTPFFESRHDSANNYGARLSGWIIPPESGEYRFAMSSDDQGALFLSTDDSPAHKQQIAAEPEWNGYREFENGVNQASRTTASGTWMNVSAPRILVAGKPYYIEALFKEGGGGDHLSVAWRLAGAGAGPVANGTAPIGGLSLATASEDRFGFQPRAATTLAGSGQVCVQFGRVLDQVSATNPSSYAIAGATITSVSLSPDRQGVLLNFSGAPAAPFEVEVGAAGGALLRDIFGRPLPVTTRLPVQGLPQMRKDVGAVSAPGVTFSRSATDFDVLAGGSDIWGNADEFHFVYENVTGDFDVQVRVAALEPVNRWSKAGLMVRETLEPGSRHLMLNVDPNGGTTRDGLEGGVGQNTYELAMRDSIGRSTVGWAQPGAALSEPGYPNAWLRLRRQDNVFMAFRSADGLSWTQLGQTNRSYAGEVHVGLATTAHNNSPGLQAMARFRDYKRVSALPSITMPPQDVVVAVGSPATFLVTANGAPPLAYRWRRNGIPVPGANVATYEIPAVQESHYGYYDVEVSNADGSVISPPAKLTAAPLAITIQAQSLESSLGSAATFSITATGSPPLRYQWRKNGQDIPGANAATYTIPSVSEGDVGSYRVVVADFTGSVVSTPATLTPTLYYDDPRGLIKAEYFLNLPGGTTLDVLTNSPAFLNNQPDIVEWTGHFESRRDFANNYGARLSGWLIPPRTGNYIFYIASDDQGALFLSSDGNPMNKVQIAAEPQFNGYREFVGDAEGEVFNPGSRGEPPANRSTPIELTEGQAYYVEALLREAGGGDNLSVTWRRPDGPAEPVNGADPISGKYFAQGITFTPVASELTATKIGGLVSVTWNGRGILQSADAVRGPYIDHPGSPASPFVLAPSAAQQYFRLRWGDVYSVNAVGYVNVLYKPGFNLIANPLNTKGNQLANVLHALPNGSRLHKWFKGYTTHTYDSVTAAWMPDAGVALAPGEGGVLEVPSEVSVTYVGQVPQGDLMIPLSAGLNLVGSKVPQAGRLSTDLKYDAVDGDTIYTHSNLGGYSVYHYSDLFGWVPSEPVIGVGQALWVKKSAAGSWVRTFSVY